MKEKQLSLFDNNSFVFISEGRGSSSNCFSVPIFCSSFVWKLQQNPSGSQICSKATAQFFLIVQSLQKLKLNFFSQLCVLVLSSSVGQSSLFMHMNMARLITTKGQFPGFIRSRPGLLAPLRDTTKLLLKVVWNHQFENRCMHARGKPATLVLSVVAEAGGQDSDCPGWLITKSLFFTLCEQNCCINLVATWLWY